MESLVSVDPFRCRMWIAHDRLEEHITEENCAKEIQSFRTHKQRKPALGRPLHNDPDHDIELISGARRLFIARLLQVPLLVELRELTDREAILEMHVDRLRKDLSPYELGLSYLAWIRGNYFETQEEMSRVLQVSNSKVSRLLKLAQLPTVLVGVLDAVSMRERWGLRLAKILENPNDKCIVIQAARDIQKITPRLPPKDAYRRLLASVAHTARGHRKLNESKHDKVVLGKDGCPLFRIRHQLDSVALLLPLEGVSASTLHNVELAVQELLQNTLQQGHEVAVHEHEPRDSRIKHPLTMEGTKDSATSAASSPASATFQADRRSGGEAEAGRKDLIH